MKPQPQGGKDVVRLKFLERPWRWYLGISQHWQAFIKTVILSAALTYFPYNLVYYIMWSRSKVDILSKQDPEYTSDGMKKYVREYKRRKNANEVEDMQEIIRDSEPSDDLAKSRIPYKP